MERTRRRLLRATVPALGGLAAGCVGGDPTPKPTDDASTATATTDAPPAADTPLLFTAEVVTQPGEGGPGTVRTALVATGEDTVRVATGPTLVFGFDPDRRLLLLPVTYVGPNRTPATPSGGCWRYADDRFLVQDIREWHDLSPGQTLGQNHRVYTVDADGPCLPAGEHRFTDESVVVGTDERDAGLAVVLTVGEDGRLSVDPRAGLDAISTG